MGKLACSESSFNQYCTHDLPYVIGMYGLNTKVHNFPFNPYDTRGNIWNAASYLRTLLDRTHGNYEKALTYYKGYSHLGHSQARHTLAIAPKK